MHADPSGRPCPADPPPYHCPECGVYDYNVARGVEHTCTVYDGPPCDECGEPTVDAHVGAPGYGVVRVCRANHHVALTPVGELSIWDVI